MPTHVACNTVCMPLSIFICLDLAFELSLVALQFGCHLPAFTSKSVCVELFLPSPPPKSESCRLLSYRFGLPLVMNESPDREIDMGICGNFCLWWGNIKDILLMSFAYLYCTPVMPSSVV